MVSRAAGKLRLLRVLNVRNNRLEFLPHELSSIPSLKNLCYSGKGPPTLALGPNCRFLHLAFTLGFFVSVCIFD